MRRVGSVCVMLAVLSALVALVVGCERDGAQLSDDAAGVEMELRITPDPPEVGPAVVEVRLTGSDGSPIDNAELEIEGNMSHAGMEPVIVDATGAQAGRYVSDGFEFTMGGDWIITVSGTLPDGRAIERSFDLSGVTS